MGVEPNHRIARKPVAKFLVPDWGIKPTLTWGFRTGLPAWRAGTTTLCQSRLYPPSQALRIGPLVFYKTFNTLCESQQSVTGRRLG